MKEEKIQMDEINFSVVIPTFNRSDLLDRLLASLYKARESYKYASIQLDRNPFISVNKDRPLGVSMIVNSKEAEEPYFLFDYDSEYHGTYAWIFCIGKGKYNIGMWLKEEKTKIREKMDLFMKSRVTEWLGNDYEVEIPLKGSLMGIGKPIVSNTDDIIIIGDAANSSNELDGEGISKAIISAKEAILKIKDNI